VDHISYHNRRSFPSDVTISAGLYKGLGNPAGRFSFFSPISIILGAEAVEIIFGTL
jgi:undecaprenyl pyrophosphate phosphatase UppP